ncbi:DEAD/DEAH box helicase [Flavobacteriaceae bacterium]|nr:DEAD/DEAH box helicase [Flavobacteriaceae bacterium]MDB9911727.1 DEAD/DEAH box helicase [Flavobacteriaceae bacterium]
MSTTFLGLGLESFLIDALDVLDIKTPTSIQTKAIPVILNQKQDVVALAKTGTGKTAGFGLPLLQGIDTQNNSIQAVVLAPTRELGQQIFKNFTDFSSKKPEISIASIVGGIPIKPQIERLKKDTHVVIATPGRLIDLLQREAIDISETSVLVLDEADEMIAVLKEGLDTIIASLPKTKRTLLFTATMPGSIKQMVQNYLSKHVVDIQADMETLGHQGIDHQYVVVKPIEKLEVLMHFLNTKEGQRGIIFCKTKAAVNKLAKKLAINKFSSGALHGSLTQGIRDRIMGQFREGHIDILIATDLAARGIDVKQISYVVQYHLPDTYDAYVHRSGRTARAGAKGLSLSVIQEEELADIPDLEQELSISFSKMEKVDALAIEENNTILWARKIFKAKPNKAISTDLKTAVKTVFHHLTKDELIEKLMANQLQQTNSLVVNTSKSKKKKKQ